MPRDRERLRVRARRGSIGRARVLRGSYASSCARTPPAPGSLPERDHCAAAASASVGGHSRSLPHANARAGLRCAHQAHRERRRRALERFREWRAGIAARPSERDGIELRGRMQRWHLILRVTVEPAIGECAKGESAYVPEQGEAALVTQDLLSPRNPPFARTLPAPGLADRCQRSRYPGPAAKPGPHNEFPAEIA